MTSVGMTEPTGLQEMGQEDAAVVARILAGDRDAYRILVERCQRELLAYVGSMVFSRHETEDLVQQAFINAYRALSSFDARGVFLPWVKAIARNLLYDRLRQRRRQQHWLDAYRFELLRAAEPTEEEDAARLAALAACVQELPADARTALQMFYGEDAGMDRIAARLGRTSSAVQRWLSRLREALRHCIAKRVADHD